MQHTAVQRSMEPYKRDELEKKIQYPEKKNPLLISKVNCKNKYGLKIVNKQNLTFRTSTSLY
jgi:hypothetical protein